MSEDKGADKGEEKGTAKNLDEDITRRASNATQELSTIYETIRNIKGVHYTECLEILVNYANINGILFKTSMLEEKSHVLSILVSASAKIFEALMRQAVHCHQLYLKDNGTSKEREVIAEEMFKDFKALLEKSQQYGTSVISMGNADETQPNSKSN